VASVIVVGLVAWLLVPGSEKSPTGVNASGAVVGVGTTDTSVTSDTAQGGTGGVGGSSVTPGAGGGSSVTQAGGAGATVGGAGVRPNAGSGDGSSTGGARGCVSPPGSAPGVTANQIKIAATLVDVAGPAANDLFGIDPPASQQADFEAVIDGINKEGGIACRKVVAQFFDANPADQSGLHQKCLDIAASGAFAVVDPGDYAVTGPLCFAQQRMSYFGGYFITQKQVDQGFPYLFELANFDHLFHDTVFALRDRGFFNAAKGFKKVGIIYRDCFPELIARTLADLHQSGVQDTQILTYDYGCPAAFASPSDIAQAVLRFKTAGVTHMTEVQDLADLANFTNIAEQQGFKPVWGLPDDQVIGIAYGNQRPNENNIANAIVITESRNAEERTPGVPLTTGTARCNGYYQSHGKPPVHERRQATGNICDQLWMLKAAIENAPALRRDALAAGLQRAKSIDFSYPQGPNDFSGTHVTYGGQFWRVAQYHAACHCWQLVDREFHPSYK
jgi:hypothetical protein